LQRSVDEVVIGFNWLTRWRDADRHVGVVASLFE
jgi:hypothetical protein